MGPFPTSHPEVHYVRAGVKERAQRVARTADFAVRVFSYRAVFYGDVEAGSVAFPTLRLLILNNSFVMNMPTVKRHTGKPQSPDRGDSALPAPGQNAMEPFCSESPVSLC